MTTLTEANSNVVNLTAYRSRPKHTGNKLISDECRKIDRAERLRSLADGCFLAVLNILTWAPFIWALHSVTTVP